MLSGGVIDTATTSAEHGNMLVSRMTAQVRENQVTIIVQVRLLLHIMAVLGVDDLWARLHGRLLLPLSHLLSRRHLQVIHELFGLPSTLALLRFLLLDSFILVCWICFSRMVRLSGELHGVGAGS